MIKTHLKEGHGSKRARQGRNSAARAYYSLYLKHKSYNIISAIRMHFVATYIFLFFPTLALKSFTSHEVKRDQRLEQLRAHNVKAEMTTKEFLTSFFFFFICSFYWQFADEVHYRHLLDWGVNSLGYQILYNLLGVKNKNNNNKTPNPVYKLSFFQEGHDSLN